MDVKNGMQVGQENSAVGTLKLKERERSIYRKKSAIYISSKSLKYR